MLSLFDNFKKIIFGKGDKLMLRMVSDESEEYAFETPIKPWRKNWRMFVDDKMKSSLLTITKRAVFDYARFDRVDWIK